MRPDAARAAPSRNAAPVPVAADRDGVVPHLAELVALRGVASRLPAARRGRVGLSGAAPSPLRGRGMEYAESRGYVPGDDARHIDWRVTARTGHAHTKLFQAERERLSLIVADTSPALYFGTRIRFKSVQAARVGAVAAWSAQRQGDRVAALRGTHAEPALAPAGGSRGVLRVLDALVRWYTQPPKDDGGLDLALERAARLLRPGARLTVLADPLAAAGIGAARWSALAMHHEVNVILLVDPLEVEPPAARLAFQLDSSRLHVDLSRKAVRDAWDAAFLSPLQAVQQALALRGVRVHVIRTDAPAESWLLGTRSP